jgi:hypothetical protein
MSYLKTFASLTSDIKALGGVPIIATAEPAKHLDSTRATTGYDGEVIVDPQNLLAAELKHRGLLEVAITQWVGYEHGMAQPAVLVLSSDNTVLQEWAIIPSLVRFYTCPWLLADPLMNMSAKHPSWTPDEPGWCEGPGLSE